ncbi:helicase-associated domain-containing protein [candidate division KSB1 bacterium]|nr:helicase-associated domain-containing protein [candidate division KSB1 bacterium]
MRLEDVLQQLNPADKAMIASRLHIKPEQLLEHLGQPNIIQNDYSLLSRRLRQIVNAVATEKGFLKFAAFREKYAPTRQDIKILQERALLFPLPNATAPQSIVLPLEFLFMLNIPMNEPHSLISVLNSLHLDTLKLIAAYQSIECQPETKPFISAKLYAHLTENTKHSVNEISDSEKRILKFVARYNGLVGTTKFFKKFPLNAFTQIPYWDVNIHDLYDVKPDRAASAVQSLFLKGLLVPLTQNMRHTIETVAIPAETYHLIAQEYLSETEAGKRKLKEKMQSSLPEAEIRTNESYFLNDIKKLLLIIVNQNPRVTQTGSLYKKDIQKICHQFGMETQYVLFILRFMMHLELVLQTDEGLIVTTSAEEFCSYPMRDVFLIARSFFLHHIHEIDGFPEFNSENVLQLILSILKEFENNFSDTSLYLEYARYYGSFIQLVEDAQRQAKRFERYLKRMLQMMYWLGFLELKSELKFVRLSASGQYVFQGIATQFAEKEPEEEQFIVMPNNEIIAPANTQFHVLLQLAEFATINSIDVVIHLGLSKSGLIRAYYKGRTIDEIRNFLIKHSKTPLPQTLLYLFGELEEKAGEVELTPVSGFLKINNPEIFQQVKVLFRKFILQTLNDNLIILRAGLNLYQLENHLKQKSYFLKSGIEPTDAWRPVSNRLQNLFESIELPQFSVENLPFSNPARTQKEIKTLLKFAIEHHIQVKIEYWSDSITHSTRNIEPQKLSTAFVEAYCHSRGSERGFRIDRIQWAELLK